MALRVVGSLRKVVTAKEIRTGRFHVPAGVRNSLFRHLTLNDKTALMMVDEIGDSHAVVLNMRSNGTKPEIMSRGGRRFAIRRNLVAGAILEFSRSNLPGHFKVTVHLPAELQPPISRQFRPPYLIGFGRRAVTEPQQTENPAVLGLRDLSAQTQPPVLLHFPTFSSAAAQMGFRLPIGSGHPLPKPSTETMLLRFGSTFICPDHPLGEQSSPVHSQEEPPTPMTELGLGLSIGLDLAPVECPSSDHPMGDPLKQPSAIMSLRFGSFIGSEHPLDEPPKPSFTTMELDLGLSIGPVQTQSPANTPAGLSLLISSENMEVDPPPANPKEAHMLDLTLAIGTTHHPATPQPLELSLFDLNILQLQPQATPETASGKIKSEAQEVGWHPGLSLSRGSNILYDHKFKEKMIEHDLNLKPLEAPYLNETYLAAKHDLQDPKPPTSLFASKPGFSSFTPYVSKGFF